MKRILFLLMAGILFCNSAYAKHECGCCDTKMKKEYAAGAMQGGFVDASVKPANVAEVMKLPDNAYVTLQGHITKRLSDDEYNFTDSTGNIVAEIGEKDWRGYKITPQDKITISGKVDRDGDVVKVDVKSLMPVEQ